MCGGRGGWRAVMTARLSLCEQRRFEPSEKVSRNDRYITASDVSVTKPARLGTLSIAPFFFHRAIRPGFIGDSHRFIANRSGRFSRCLPIDRAPRIHDWSIRPFVFPASDRSPLLAPKRVFPSRAVSDLSRSRKRAARTSPPRASERVALARRSSLPCLRAGSTRVGTRVSMHRARASPAAPSTAEHDESTAAGRGAL